MNTGILAALSAALLFGAGAPLAKWLLDASSPWMLAGIFYLGSGVGLWIYRRVSGAMPVRLAAPETRWLATAIAFGGVAGPVLLMWGLSAMPASSASLLLNAEGVFTALLAWFAFEEHFDRRIAWGMAAIAAGAVLLSWPAQAGTSGVLPAAAVLGACLCWGIDNNLTRKVSLGDATWIACVKGLCAGAVNLGLAVMVGDSLPRLPVLCTALVIGFLAYGVSLALFVVGLRHLGTARTGAYFSVAPFIGTVIALVGGETLTPTLALAGVLMGLGVWLHLTEHHAHAHVHPPLQHDHMHTHDEHHQHEHPWAPGRVWPAQEPHAHMHRHEALTHSHAHFPDAHHQHSH